MKKYACITTVAISAIFLLAGCDKTKQNLEKPALASADKNPLNSFKRIFDRCQSELVDSDRVYPGGAGGFIRTIIREGKISYDVTKTDSLVSPYAAYIKISFIEKSGAGQTETSLRDPNTLAVSIVNHWKLMYALQDGKWKFQQALYSAEMPTLGIAEQVPYQKDTNSLFIRVPGTEACIPS